MSFELDVLTKILNEQKRTNELIEQMLTDKQADAGKGAKRNVK